MTKKISEGEVKRKFGERVRSLRRDKGMSQEKLAFEIEMDLTSVNEIEKGHRSPRLYTIHKIAQALGVLTSDLFTY